MKKITSRGHTFLLPKSGLILLIFDEDFTRDRTTDMDLVKHLFGGICFFCGISQFLILHGTFSDTLSFPFSPRFLNHSSAQKDMTIAKLYLAFPHMVDLLLRVYTTQILIYVILPLIPARDIPSDQRTKKVKWNHGHLRTF